MPRTAASSVTLASAIMLVPPRRPISSARARASSAELRAWMTTAAPSSTRRSAMARPIRRTAPVTRATLPARGFIGSAGMSRPPKPLLLGHRDLRAGLAAAQPLQVHGDAGIERPFRVQRGEELRRRRAALRKTGIGPLIARNIFGVDRRLQRLEDGMSGRLALQRDDPERPEGNRPAFRTGSVADADPRAEILVQPFEPRRRVHRIAPRRLIHLQQQRAEIADRRLAGMDADAGDAERYVRVVLRAAETLGVFVDLQGASHRTLGMIGL